MGLFNKEACCLCGGKTGMLDKKTASGKVCKDCKEKLSVWFTEYKTATKEELQAQIDKKEAELARMKELNFNKFFGDFGAILIDEEARVFVAVADTSQSLFGTREKITTIDDMLKFRPDLISFDQVEDLEIEVKEMTNEDKKMEDGKQVSYDPPHMKYSERFTLRFKLKNHPYIDSLYVPLDKGDVVIKQEGKRLRTSYGTKLAAYILDLPEMVRENTPVIYNNDSLIDWFYHSPFEMPEYSYGFKCTHTNWDQIKKYQYYLLMAREIEKTIMGERK